MQCLEKMKTTKIAENKNYFAMSLKMFFMSLTEDELEFLCHNYVHSWINDELQKTNRLLSKYQVEQKLSYVNAAKTQRDGSMDLIDASFRRKSPAKTPRYMAPTISQIQTLNEQKETDVVKLEDHIRGGRGTSFNASIN